MNTDNILLANLATEIIPCMVLVGMGALAVASVLMNTRNNKNIQNEINRKVKQR